MSISAFQFPTAQLLGVDLFSGSMISPQLS